MDQKQLWRFGIKFKWNNHFAFRNSRRTIPVIFEPFFVVSGHDHTVNVSSPTDTNSRANAENWFTNTGADTAAHEFGHLLGLEDEYNLTLTRYVEVTGGKEPATQNQIGGYTLPNVMGPSSRLPVGRHMMPFLMHLNNMERGLAASAGRRPDFYKLTKQK